MPPAWLLPEQVPSFRRVLAAVRRHGGAVLADPVGSGKTYVSLAVAHAMNRGSTACLVPASLHDQWEATARCLGVAVALSTHQRVSRGQLPSGTRGLVIIDESHHFRNPHTRRYYHLAPWLVGRPVLLVTATPIVNRGDDLAHQLLLAVRDNTLALDGVTSLRTVLAGSWGAPALGQLVIERELVKDHRPARIESISLAAPSEEAALARLIDALNRLRLSKSEPIGALIRSVLLRAAGSSPAAYGGALRRYRKLLLHARDACRAGRGMDRAELRHFTGDLGDQLVWWELLPGAESATDLVLDDLSPLGSLIGAADAVTRGEDLKLDRLRGILSDATPTLVFSYSRDTVRYIRERLADLRLAWCTGEHAGVGRGTLARREVLAWFRQPTTSPLAPRHLIVTDVAAEGLDLQRAARVVHYDLPWTPTRLEQREGRSMRCGSTYSEVEAVRFAPPAVVESWLKIEAILARKARLPARAGLGPHGRHLWRWRSALVDRFGGGEARAGVALLPSSSRSGLLAGFALYRSDEPVCLSATVLWLEPDGTWTETPETITARLTAAVAEPGIWPLRGETVREWLTLLAVPIRERLALTRGRRWIKPDPSTAARHLASRLQGMVRDAARQHHAGRLEQLEQALEFVTGGHTAGEAALVQRLAKATDGELWVAAGKLPGAAAEWHGIEVRLTGLIVFGPAQAGIAELASPECLHCKPLSSTSTEP
ncbi:MAG TPA: DEAD/DEAH box helicase [Gemmatimonadales bacterium]|nr:DEAD/DEAH box helicase [Gemmatimonadales bacterium]